jgi:hypothetical protein
MNTSEKTRLNLHLLPYNVTNPCKRRWWQFKIGGGGPFFFLLDPMCAQSALLESWLCIGTLTSSSVRIAPNILTTHLVMLLLFNTSAAWRSGYSRACGVYIFLVKCTRIWDESKDLIFRLGYESGCVLINSAPGSVRTFCLQWNHFARAKCHSSVITKLKLGRVTWVTH